MGDPFCWYELLTTDTAAAADFYRKVVGWTTRPMGDGGLDYTVFQATGDVGVAGLMTLPQEARDMGGRPGWIGYVAVADVDASQAKAVALGGKVLKPASDIPDIGRFAVMADPFGAVFALFHGQEPQNPPQTGAGPGSIAWRELMAGDLDQAWSFYSALFGWTKDAAHDMGAMGVYQLFRTGGEAATGGMMTKPPTLPASFWTYYFTVDAIRAATDRIGAAGGQVANGPMQVPGGDWIVQGLDPQGAMFALFSNAE
jgi:predicted enzyme related to lactoylglutathione lyase